MIHPLGINARISLFLVPYVMLFSTVGIAYFLDTRVFPVVSEFKVESASYAKGELTLSGSMRKVRDCAYVGLAVYGVPELGPKNELSYDFRGEFVKHRSQGFQTWGPWTVTVPVKSRYEHIEIVASHRCLGPWVQNTTYVEYAMGEKVFNAVMEQR